MVIMHTVSLFTQSIAKFIEIDKRLLAVVSSEQEERTIIQESANGWRDLVVIAEKQ